MAVGSDGCVAPGDDKLAVEHLQRLCPEAVSPVGIVGKGAVFYLGITRLLPVTTHCIDPVFQILENRRGDRA